MMRLVPRFVRRWKANSRERLRAVELHEMRAMGAQRAYLEAMNLEHPSMKKVGLLKDEVSVEKMLMHLHRLHYLKVVRKMSGVELFVFAGQMNRQGVKMNHAEKECEALVAALHDVMYSLPY